MLLQLFISKIDTELLKAILCENLVSITAGLDIPFENEISANILPIVLKAFKSIYIKNSNNRF